MSERHRALEEYAKNSQSLRKNDVENLLEWAGKQAHLPRMTEYQCILFLQSCYFGNEKAKIAIENYYAARTIYTDLFFGLHPKDIGIQLAVDAHLIHILPKPAPSGFRVILFQLIDTNPDKFNIVDQVRFFDMFINLIMHLDGTNNGLHFVFNCKGAVLAHLLKFNPVLAKKYLFYFQEALPIRLKDFHVINAPSWIDRALSMVKVFLKAEIFDMIRIHSNFETFYDVIPREILPEDYGYAVCTPELKNLAEKTRMLLNENADFFNELEKQRTDESKRAFKSRNYDEMFGGIQGTFKKLEVD